MFYKCVKTRRKIDNCVRKYVKTRRQINIFSANVSKHVVKLTFLFVNRSKHVVKLTLILQMCQNTSLNAHSVRKYVKTRYKINIYVSKFVKTHR